MLEPAEMGHARLAAVFAEGNHPHVISGEVTKGIGLSNAVEGCFRTQSPSAKALLSK